jgi:hypothetical protein
MEYSRKADKHLGNFFFGEIGTWRVGQSSKSKLSTTVIPWHRAESAMRGEGRGKVGPLSGKNLCPKYVR